MNKKLKKMHSSSKLKVWVALANCQEKGFTFRPGFVLGRDAWGWFAASGHESQGDYLIYRQDVGGEWGATWEDVADSDAAHVLAQSRYICSLARNWAEIAEQRSHAGLPEQITPLVGTASLVEADGWETNPFADPGKACNGGGYSQPAGHATLCLGDAAIHVNYEDLDQGEFGRTERWQIVIPSAQCGLSWSTDDEDNADACIAIMDGILSGNLREIQRLAAQAVTDCARQEVTKT